VRDEKGIPTIHPAKEGENDPNDILQTVWNMGPVPDLKWETFDELRARVAKEWNALPKVHDPIHADTKKVIADWVKDFEEHYAERLSLAENKK
jgi:hypothetical protein